VEPQYGGRDKLKTACGAGATHVILEQLDFKLKLATLLPKPRGNLTRFNGVFAPNSNQRIHAGF